MLRGRERERGREDCKISFFFSLVEIIKDSPETLYIDSSDNVVEACLFNFQCGKSILPSICVAIWTAHALSRQLFFAAFIVFFPFLFLSLLFSFLRFKPFCSTFFSKLISEFLACAIFFGVTRDHSGFLWFETQPNSSLIGDASQILYVLRCCIECYSVI